MFIHVTVKFSIRKLTNPRNIKLVNYKVSSSIVMIVKLGDN